MGRNRDKFVELAQKRMVKTIKDLRLLGNLANKSNYSYTEEDIRKILSTLETELKNLRRKFENTGASEEIVFKL